MLNILFAAGDSKVRDQHHLTGKPIGSVYWNCNISFILIKKFL